MSPKTDSVIRSTSQAGLLPAEPTDLEVDDLADLPSGPVTSLSVTRWTEGGITCEADEVATEEPLEIRVRGRAISVTMRTPGHDVELVAGFLLSEGVISRPSDLLRVEPCGRNQLGNVVNAILAPDVAVDFSRLTRHVFAHSSCGLCGKATIESVQNGLSPLPPIVADAPRLNPDLLKKMAAAMQREQAVFARTGSVHAAALFDGHGQLLALREDVGRHNAVDKVLGRALLQRSTLAEDLAPSDMTTLLVSGRVSFEIMQKTLAGRIPIVGAVSAPSSLAVDFARRSGQTLIGFLRPGRFNVYTHPQRIDLCKDQ